MLFTFALGFCGLGLEILTLRVISTIAGSNILSTSNVIAVVILSLSLGYYFSSRTTNEQLQRHITYSLRLSGLLIIAAPVVWKILQILIPEADFSSSFFIQIFILSIIGTFLIGSPASIVIGYCSPLVFSLLREYYPSTKNTAAISFLFGGLGSLTGSLLPSGILIPLFGIRVSFIILGALLLICSLLIGEKTKLQTFSTLIIAIILALLSAILENKPSDVLAIKESAIQTIIVKQDPVHSECKTLHYDGGFGIQSRSDPNLKYIGKKYYGDFLLFGPTNRESEFNILVLGSAGGTVSSYYSKIFGENNENVKIENIDLDPSVHDIAKIYFSAENPHTQFITCDARFYVLHAKKINKQYDLIVLDMFSRDLFLPNEILTTEFFQQLHAITTPTGVISMNVHATNIKTTLIQSLSASIKSHYKHAYITKRSNGNTGLQQFLISASNNPIPFKQLSLNENLEKWQGYFYNLAYQTKPIKTDAPPFTDDKISIDHLIISMILDEV